MAILVGFHVEGTDHLILKELLEIFVRHEKERKGWEEDGEHFCADYIPTPGRGWTFVVKEVGQALQRFYQQCAQLVVIGIDNDGDKDLVASGAQEDPLHPRHWNHTLPERDCRYCWLLSLVEAEREKLKRKPLPRKPPEAWPVLIAVPVESIEAWLLELQAIVDPSKGLSPAENHSRQKFKQALYGQPLVTQQLVNRIALPIVRQAQIAELAELRSRSKSFELFATQVDRYMSTLLTPADCWAEGDRASER